MDSFSENKTPSSYLISGVFSSGDSLLIRMFVPVGADMIHDEILHAIGVGDGAELKSLLFTRALYVYIAIIEKSLEKSVNFDGDILHSCEFQFAHLAGEEPALLDIDDAVIGDDPGVEPDIDPDEEEINPAEEDDGIFDEEEESTVFRSEEPREKCGERDEREEDCPHERDDRGEVHEDIEPVPVGYFQYFFFS